MQYWLPLELVSVNRIVCVSVRRHECIMCEEAQEGGLPKWEYPERQTLESYQSLETKSTPEPTLTRLV